MGRGSTATARVGEQTATRPLPLPAGGARQRHVLRGSYASNLNREDAKRYRRRHTSRLISTTTVAMINVAASSTSKRPASLARLMVLPRPGAESIFP